MKKIILLIFMFSIAPTKANNLTYLTNQKTIALTFDDGPSIYTKKITDLLEQYGFNATFFMVGSKIDTYKEDVQYLHKKGNEIGNHTYTHIWSTKYKNEIVLKEIEKTNQKIYNVTKQKCKLFRPSYGAINKQLKKVIKEEIIMWTLDSKDWKYKNRKIISAKVLKNIKDKDIVLMHEPLKETYESLKIILPKLKKENYQIVTVSTLNEILKLREFNE